MPFQLTEHDIQLVSNLNMEISGGTPEFGPNFGVVIPFQFPPTISSDSKDGVWDLIPFNKWEPQPIFNGANARRVSIRAVYVVTGHTQNGILWNVARVAGVVRDTRAIFYVPADGKLPVFKIRMYDHIPEKAAQLTFRCLSVSEKPGDTLITDSSGTYALKTEVAIDLEMVTQIVANGEAEMPWPHLVPQPKPEWY